MTRPPDHLLRRLDWRTARRLGGQRQGRHRTALHGPGWDVADFREYHDGDDARHIDWNVSARLGEPYLRQYTEERELTTWLAVDRTASMRLGAGGGKDGLQSDLVTGLTGLMTSGGDLVGAVVYGEGPTVTLTPRTGRLQTTRIAREMSRPVPEKGRGEPTDLARMLAAVDARARRRSVVVVLSDLVGTGDWERVLTRLSYRHDTVVIRIVDPVERELPHVGLLLVEDAETGEQLLVDSADPAFRRRFQVEVAAEDRRIADAVRRSGARLHTVDTSADPVSSLVDIVLRTHRSPAGFGAHGGRP